MTDRGNVPIVLYRVLRCIRRPRTHRHGDAIPTLDGPNIRIDGYKVTVIFVYMFHLFINIRFGNLTQIIIMITTTTAATATTTVTLCHDGTGKVDMIFRVMRYNL